MIKSYHSDTKRFTEENQGFQNVLKKASASAKAGHSKQLSKGQKVIIFTWKWHIIKELAELQQLPACFETPEKGKWLLIKRWILFFQIVLYSQL